MTLDVTPPVDCYHLRPPLPLFCPVSCCQTPCVWNALNNHCRCSGCFRQDDTLKQQMNSFLLSTQSQHEIQALDNKVLSLSLILVRGSMYQGLPTFPVFFASSFYHTVVHLSCSVFYVISRTSSSCCNSTYLFCLPVLKQHLCCFVLVRLTVLCTSSRRILFNVAFNWRIFLTSRLIDFCPSFYIFVRSRSVLFVDWALSYKQN